MYECDNPECKKNFCVPGRISFEKKGVNVFDPLRTIIEKPICPHCESINFHEVFPK